MRELACYITNKFPGGIEVGIPPGGKAKFKTKDTFEIGQKVWVSYNFTNNTIAAVSSSPGREVPSPNNLPDPMAAWGFEEETHPIVEEREVLVVDDITYPETDEEAY